MTKWPLTAAFILAVFRSFLLDLKVHRLFDVLHGDPRFDALVKRIGIPGDADPDIPILKQAKAEYAELP